MSRLRFSLALVMVLLAFSFLNNYRQPSSQRYLAQSPFRLPVAPGLTVFVSQGNNDTLHDHVGKAKWAFDFTVSTTNFVVTAAQGGTVIGADDSSTTGCGDVGCWTQANYVVIADDDRTTAALYLHLLHDSLKVKPGMHVTQGQPLGLADTTGWATGTHLHFQVEDIPSTAAQQQQYPGWWWTQSVSVSFSNPEVLAQDADGVPQEGQSFLASKQPTLTATQTLSAYCNAQKNTDTQTFYNLLPHRIQVHIILSELFALMFDPLLRYAKTGVISNCTVESVTVSQDGNTAVGVIVYMMVNGKVLRLDQPLVMENGVWKVEADKVTLISSQTSTPTPPVPVPTPTPTPSFGVYVGESWTGTYTPPCLGTTCTGITNPATLTIQSIQPEGQNKSAFTGTLSIYGNPDVVHGTVGSNISDFSSDEQNLLQAAIATTGISSTQAYIVFSDKYGTLFAVVQDQQGGWQGISKQEGLIGGSLDLKKN